MTPSFRQLPEIIFLKRDVKPSEYVSGGFFKIFQYAYGKPMEYGSDFYALMTTKDKNKDKAWQKLCDTTFVEFAYCVDDKVTKWNLSTVWREDMEGAWVQKAVSLYEDEILRLGDTFTSNPYVREGLQCQLKKVIGRRFHPMLRVEKYWAKMGDGMDGKLWMKRVAAQEAVDEMEFAKPGLGEEGIDMDGLLKMMGDLQVQAANDTADPQELTAEEAMIKAQAYFNI